MKILVPCDGEDFNDKIHSNLIKAKHFICIDTQKDIWEVIENVACEKNESTISKIIDQAVRLKVHFIIIRDITREEFTMLNEKGMKVFIAEKMSVKQAIDLFKKGAINSID